jgi:hypothetical protein
MTTGSMTRSAKQKPEGEAARRQKARSVPGRRSLCSLGDALVCAASEAVVAEVCFPRAPAHPATAKPISLVAPGTGLPAGPVLRNDP